MVAAPKIDVPDAVTRRLQLAPSQNPEAVVGWLEHQLERDGMRQQVWTCALKAWITITGIAAASTAIAWYFQATTANAMQIFDFSNANAGSLSEGLHSYMPMILLTTTMLLLTMLPLAWAFGRLPGFSSALSSVDWATTGVAMSRLLTIGCPYPEAFRTTAKAIACSGQRQWLLDAANRVEAGGQAIPEDCHQAPGSAILHVILSTQRSPMQREWQLASEHYLEVAQRKIGLITGAAPVVATILAGTILWLSISTTLNAMLTAFRSFMEDFT